MYLFLYFHLLYFLTNFCIVFAIKITKYQVSSLNPLDLDHISGFTVICWTSEPKNLLNIWSSADIQLHDYKSFHLFSGQNETEVTRNYQRNKRTWIWSDTIKITVYKDVCYGINSDSLYSLEFIYKSSGKSNRIS